MNTTGKKLFYYNIPQGIDLSKYDIRYDGSVPVYILGGGFIKIEARVDIGRNVPLSEWVNSPKFKEEQEYYLDLVQALMEHLVFRHIPSENDKAYNTVVNIKFSDDSVSFCLDYYIQENELNLSILNYGNLRDKFLNHKEVNEKLKLTIPKIKKMIETKRNEILAKYSK